MRGLEERRVPDVAFADEVAGVEYFLAALVTEQYLWKGGGDSVYISSLRLPLHPPAALGASIPRRLEFELLRDEGVEVRRQKHPNGHALVEAGAATSAQQHQVVGVLQRV